MKMGLLLLTLGLSAICTGHAQVRPAEQTAPQNNPGKIVLTATNERALQDARESLLQIEGVTEAIAAKVINAAPYRTMTQFFTAADAMRIPYRAAITIASRLAFLDSRIDLTDKSPGGIVLSKKTLLTIGGITPVVADRMIASAPYPNRASIVKAAVEAGVDAGTADLLAQRIVATPMVSLVRVNPRVLDQARKILLTVDGATPAMIDALLARAPYVNRQDFLQATVTAGVPEQVAARLAARLLFP